MLIVSERGSAPRGGERRYGPERRVRCSTLREGVPIWLAVFCAEETSGVPNTSVATAQGSFTTIDFMGRVARISNATDESELHSL